MSQEWIGIVKHLVGVKAASDLGVFVCSKRVQLRIRGASTVMTSFVRAMLLVVLIHCVIWRTAHTTNKSPEGSGDRERGIREEEMGCGEGSETGSVTKKKEKKSTTSIGVSLIPDFRHKDESYQILSYDVFGARHPIRYIHQVRHLADCTFSERSAPEAPRVILVLCCAPEAPPVILVLCCAPEAPPVIPGSL
ncbi:hypothetical protein LSAT2_000216 [Lamellibrachia satsuma]|nr:hypothetical protein LSAT2_000216 [Lamellibrachia satsuma]